uniref:xylose isomerase n=1 Tax=Brassica oleracea var. oleracea TaxID=109376 RepID=A0A0D3ALE8_BRAOL
VISTYIYPTSQSSGLVTLNFTKLRVLFVWLNTMKKVKIFMIFLCFNAASFLVSADPQTCPADSGGKCSGPDDWEGEFFPEIPHIKYEGPKSSNPLTYKWYNAEEEILGKKMKIQCCVLAYITCGLEVTHLVLLPSIGPGKMVPTLCLWLREEVKQTCFMFTTFSILMRANFEFLKKLGVDWWCFHDRDIAPDGPGNTLEKSNKNLDEVIELAKELQKETKIRPLWGTPKPQEPTKHQYDWNAATAANFLRKYGLINEFKLNIECNDARLSGHTCHHELETARINGLLGNIDANTGHAQTGNAYLISPLLIINDSYQVPGDANNFFFFASTGWDTDQFLTDVGEATMVMMSVLRNDGIAPGDFNLDAKLRRESTDVEDLFIAHISGMDTLARGLRNAVKLLEVN